MNHLNRGYRQDEEINFTILETDRMSLRESFMEREKRSIEQWLLY